MACWRVETISTVRLSSSRELPLPSPSYLSARAFHPLSSKSPAKIINPNEKTLPPTTNGVWGISAPNRFLSVFLIISARHIGGDRRRRGRVLSWIRGLPGRSGQLELLPQHQRCDLPRPMFLRLQVRPQQGHP